MNITVYLGAHEGNDPSYKKAVEELGAWIADSGNRLVYGIQRGVDGEYRRCRAVPRRQSNRHRGTNVREPRCRARGTDRIGHSAGHHRASHAHDRAWRCVHRLSRRHGHFEEHQRGRVENLPRQLSQPCVFYNLNGFYNDMRAFLQRMVDAGFSTAERQQGIYFASNLAEIERIIANPRI